MNDLKRTYAEVKGEIPFDWNTALGTDLGDIAGWRIMENKASNWPTCACGNLCEVLPRAFGGQPLDFVLVLLGTAFYERIKGVADHNASLEKRVDAQQAAVLVLQQIETRSMFLLKQMGVWTD